MFFFLDKSKPLNGITKTFNGIAKPLNGINNIKKVITKDKKDEIYEKWDSNIRQ